MEPKSSARLSVSTWSLHRALGRPLITGPDHVAGAPSSVTGAALSLLELPARIRDLGISTLEICHFHVLTPTPGYLSQLKRALDAAGVELWSLLIDGGDITDPDNVDRDLAWIAGWIDVAAQLGAHHARVVAGKALPTAAALSRSRSGLQRLSAYARGKGVRLMTENWQALMAGPEQVLWLLDALDGEVGLCADFGNWQGAGKYADLAQILPRADSCHAKCHFSSAETMDRADYVRCMELTRSTGFSGPYTLIYDGPGADEWAGLALEKEVVLPFLQ